ncbi:MAG: hydrolase [bacterium]
MTLNHVPKLSKDNSTGCCPRFNPEEWDGQTFEFKDKLFVRGITHSFFYMPLDMSKMMTKTWAAITAAGADSKDEFVMLSLDVSPWKCEHLLSVTKEVPGQDNVKLTGKYRAKVFEGPFQDAPKWIKAMNAKGKVYLYYTTCPKCMKVYGKNYVVAFALI